MYQKNEWQFWAIGGAFFASVVASAAMETPLPLVAMVVVIVVVGAVVEWLEQRRRHRPPQA